jgi:GT2 family glycosyltransferase
LSIASVIVVGYGDEPGLELCLASISSQLEPGDEIVLVDNGVSHLEERLPGWPAGLRLVRTGGNLGFAGGINAGADVATGSVLIFVNSDLVVGPSSLQAIQARVRANPIVLTTGCLRLSTAPQTINSAGNPVHYTGVAWAGSFGDDAGSHAQVCAVASASGGFMAVNHDRWNTLGGFEPSYFMYHEDVEFSLRWWMSGGRVEYVPGAVAVHDYDFARNAKKMYYLERNRLMTVMTVFPTSVLARAAPALVVLEVGLLLLAIAQGWLGQKLRSYGWLWRNRVQILKRRESVQESFSEPAETLMRLFSPRLEAAGFGNLPGLGMLNAGLAAYWRVVRLKG